MAVWKRYNGKRIKGEGAKGKGVWIVEFSLRGHYIKEAIPEARTKQQAQEQKQKSNGRSSMINTTQPPAIRTSLNSLTKSLCRGRRHRSEVGRMTRRGRVL